ncbi:MAG: hypothetical protein H0T04_04490 [Chloroflexi bacterium]|nr:hypothetical protein [Chloroflexota bacterium]
MTGSITKTPGTAASRASGRDPSVAGWRSTLERVDPVWIGGIFVLIALAVYAGSNPERRNFYNHFVWQADAWLQGRVAITYPVVEPFRNDYFQDVLPLSDQPGLALIPFPPLPAIVLLPFVAVFGLATDAALVAAVFGALNVGLCWRMIQGVTADRGAAVLSTIFYAFGTVAWYAAMLGSTWFLAHVLASTFLFVAISAALDAERRQHLAGRARLVLGVVDPRQFLAGLLLGVAALARLPAIFGAPFFVFVGGGGSLFRRAFSAGLGALVPVALLLLYNLAVTGHVFHPAYQYLYETEYSPRPELIHHGEWAIEDPRYLPQNAVIMLAWPPTTPALSADICADRSHPDFRPLPEGLGLIFDRDCPLVRPDPLGMSLLLSSPAYLLGIPGLLAMWRSGRRRWAAGVALAVAAIALLNLMHFSQGWVQFGYRFSNDFAPFAMIPVALGIALYGVRPATVIPVALSVLINAWGVYWGVTLGW